MNNRKINAKIIADSKNEYGQRITTFVLTYPRIIHAELLTHRLFSRNAASSRAIPASKMIKDIEEDPFVSIAFQKAHKGMQGTEYLEGEALDIVKRRWITASKHATAQAQILTNEEVTKQITNRLLEPFQWYTCILTATEFDNFFELRCPQYHYEPEDLLFKSRKDFVKKYEECFGENWSRPTLLEWLKINKGQGEIHISSLAEAMWDARNESEPKQLKAGEWHIPFGDNINDIKVLSLVDNYNQLEGDAQQKALQGAKVKIATARCARVSYLNFEGKDDYEADIKLYDRLLTMGHMSPFEHCARAMNEVEYKAHMRTGIMNGEPTISAGWSGNFRGFVQLRKEIELWK